MNFLVCVNLLIKRYETWTLNSETSEKNMKNRLSEKISIMKNQVVNSQILQIQDFDLKHLVKAMMLRLIMLIKSNRD
jgi:hypothetical protein